MGHGPKTSFRTVPASLAAALVILAPAWIRPAIPQETRGETTPSALRQHLQETLDAFHAAGQFPGATAAIVLADGTTVALATGISDKSLSRPMRPDDRMPAGSVGKTFVSALALQLVAEGKIGLDDPIAKWFTGDPWFPRLPNGPDITVRMLMNHTSGLVRYEFKEQFTRDLTADPHKVWRPEECVAYILDTAPPFAAGKGWDYSDTNYIVLGMILERELGSTYYEGLRRRLLGPLGLKNVIPADRRDLPGVAQGYAGAGNAFGGSDAMIADGKFVINPQFEWTGGGVVTTAEDLARWAKALYEGKAFDRALMGAFLEGVPARLGPEARYGLGVILRPTRLGASRGHSGFFPGYITEMMYLPDSGIAGAIQVNTSVPRATGRPLRDLLVDLIQAARDGGK